MTNETNNSPLAEAQVESIDELWARLDEHTIRRSFDTPAGQFDLGRAIDEYRRQREVWQRAESSGAKRAPKAKRTSPTETTADDVLAAMNGEGEK